APELVLRIVLGQHLGDRRREGGLAVIDVSDRPDVYVRLTAVKFFLCHLPPVSLKILKLQQAGRPTLPGQARRPALPGQAAQPTLLGYLALYPGYDLFRDRPRHFLVPREVHRKAAAALRARAQFGRVTEHIAQRHTRPDHLRRSL